MPDPRPGAIPITCPHCAALSESFAEGGILTCVQCHERYRVEPLQSITLRSRPLFPSELAALADIEAMTGDTELAPASLARHVDVHRTREAPPMRRGLAKAIAVLGGFALALALYGVAQGFAP